jgi:hypothetical protein
MEPPKAQFGNSIVLAQSEENGFGLVVFKNDTEYTLRSYWYDKNHDCTKWDRPTSPGTDMVIERHQLSFLADFFVGELKQEYKKCLENQSLQTG